MAANGITREAFEADFAESGATQSSNPAVETLKRRVIWVSLPSLWPGCATANSFAYFPDGLRPRRVGELG